MSIISKKFIKAVAIDIDKKSTTIIFQLILMTITLAIVGYLSYKPLFEFNSLDSLPEVKSFNPKVGHISQMPNSVKVGLFIYDFPKFDFVRNDFIFDGLIFFEFDPTILTLETLNQFSFRKGKILYKSDPNITLKNGLIFVRYDIKVEFKTDLNYKMFPFNNHRINIILDNDFLYFQEIMFKPSIARFIINPDMYVAGWKEYNKDILAGYYSAQLQRFKPSSIIRHPRVGFTIEYLKNSMREMISIFLPLFLLFFMSIFSFAMEPKTYFGSIIGLSTGSVTGMLSYRYVINNLSPNVGYFMFSDIIYFVFLAIVIFVFLCNSQAFDLTAKQKAAISLLMHLIIVFTFIYLFKFWSI
ncbi:hypothetical protein [Candidatus Babela massiliensis]|uniref:Uncharacterized protein n=1 Tax=Candidatus Babela massiliensis TaxID=673862 RepID=V6DIV9_9BACT|nr:hypothetical protein [Candidatus Babela massiliensis]CDK30868.1 hypothetical protein BABL1_gene_145 [Candidatus Babela massiliensis]